MQTITLKLELQKPTKEKIAMYRKMTVINTAFSNWLLHVDGLQTATLTNMYTLKSYRF
ncbi:hypothetical protein [Oceanobacillus polygoni]|uniref:Transposase n=1 Tax=Oceanobacillus polygoni TaxID=1235259 RepID=A0A9X0YPR9_9BACI|nr:hypothetical protein [Oceanobacillus polygoni]MBP2076695.1 hypothetical protein [Oceanobacillus polygoni]